MLRIYGALLCFSLASGQALAKDHSDCLSLFETLRIQAQVERNSVTHKVDSDDISLKTISLQDIFALNARAARELSNSNIDYRVLSASDSSLVSRLDRALTIKHPLFGYVKLFEIIHQYSAEGQCRMDCKALDHPLLNQRLQELHEMGATMIVDPSMSLSRAGGMAAVAGTQISIRPATAFATVEHEIAHLRYHYEFVVPLLESGLLDHFKNRFLKFRHAHPDDWEPDYPFTPKVVQYLDVDRDLSLALKKYAARYGESEYQSLLRDGHPVGFALQAIKRGYIYINEINEMVATSVEQHLYRQEGFARFGIDRLSTEMYSLRFKIKELEQRKDSAAKIKLRFLRSYRKQILLLLKLQFRREYGVEAARGFKWHEF